MLRRELEPGEEIERLAEIARVMKPARHRREILQADRGVAGGLLENPPPLVLREIPPRLVLPDRDQRSMDRLRPPERGLSSLEAGDLGSGGITDVAGEAAQHPASTGRNGRKKLVQNVQAGCGCESL